MVQPHAQYPRPQPKKSGNGCLIAMAVVGGLLLILGIFVAIGVYKFASSKEGKQLISIVGEGAKVMAEAQTAPGTAELKKLGCKQPMVMSMERLAKIVQEINDAGSDDMGGVAVMVMCPVGLLDKPPSCDDAARTYVSAVPTPPGKFVVNVTVQGKNEPHCNNLYAPDGKRLGDFGGPTPNLPQSPGVGE
jgi:hypothetical protein